MHPSLSIKAPIMLVVALALSSPLLGQDALDATPSPHDLRVQLTLWGWLTAVNGDITAMGNPASVDASFGDILDDSDSILAISGRIEFGYDRFGVFVDAFYSDLGVDDAVGAEGGVADIDFEETFVDFGVMYRVGSWLPRGDAQFNDRDLTLDLYAGGRYSGLELSVDPVGDTRHSQDRDWLDPIVGAKVVLPLSRAWRLEVNGDIGGFGIESDLTWSATGVIGYEFDLFGADASLLFGYRAIGWDFSEGAGESRFEWDVIQHGVLLGFAVRF